MDTEDEAKKKLCPMVKPDRGEGYAPVYCIASGCMAWRWGLTWDKERTPVQGGYCGLAGKQ